VKITAASDRAMLVTFAETMDAAASRAARALADDLAERPILGQVDVHPAYVSVLVTFDPLAADPGAFEDELARRAGRSREARATEPRTIVVPVRYDGPDLEEVARACALPAHEVVRRHAAAVYEVVFLGFTPGFPYLSGLPDELFTRRREQPRRRVEAGSVAIAGAQAGIYPVTSPGGWSVLGRTSLVLFDPSRDTPALLSAGDRVRFVPVEAL
jgi:KipI family sensor histidine kinase inhibitor